MPYLLKTEPDKYSFDDLLRDGETTWDGISNNQPLLTLPNKKKGAQPAHSPPQHRKSRRRPGQGRLRDAQSGRPQSLHRPHPARQAPQARKTPQRDPRSRRLPGLHPLPPVPPLRSPPHPGPIRLAHPALTLSNSTADTTFVISLLMASPIESHRGCFPENVSPLMVRQPDAARLSDAAGDGVHPRLLRCAPHIS